MTHAVLTPVITRETFTPKDVTRFVAQNVLTRDMGDTIVNAENNVFLCHGRIHDNKNANVLVRVTGELIDVQLQVPGNPYAGFGFAIFTEDANFQRVARYLDHYINDGRLYGSK